MADEQQRARPLGELRFEQLQRLESRSLVGSSRTSTLAGRVNSRASSRRLRSPPDRALTGDRARSGGKRKSREVAVNVARAAVDGDRVVALADRVEDGSLRIELLALLIVVGDLHIGAASHVRRCPAVSFAEQQPQQRRLARRRWARSGRYDRLA